MKILGIESSCDETSASVICNGNELLSNVVASSMEQHAQFGGVVPEIAARSHIESITPVISQALLEAKISWDDIDAIAVTKGPGLGGSLLVGVITARTLAILKNKPLYGINHVHAHVLVNFLTKTTVPDYKLPDEPPKFPLIGLIVSGGHTQLVHFNSYFDYRLLGQTKDDAVGEAFDKVAKIIGLPYPGGPSISRLAMSGNPDKYIFPKARLESKYDFSFSGLKTAVLRMAQKEIGEDYNFPSYLISEKLSSAQKADFSASFQRIAIETLLDKTAEAVKEYSPSSVVVAGGVAANLELRKQIKIRIKTPVIYTDIKLCTDNGAMIATAGYFAHQTKQEVSNPHSLESSPGLAM